MYEHMQRHQTEKIKCKICLKVYISKQSLSSHMRKVHLKKKLKFECSICHVNYKYNDSLRDHVTMFHFKEKHKVTYKCDICGVEELVKFRMENHINSAHTKPFKCFEKTCLKRFITNNARKVHHLSTHSQDLEVHQG